VIGSVRPPQVFHFDGAISKWGVSPSCRSGRVSANAVQLGTRSSGNAGPRWAGWLGPGPVMGPLHVPFDVLALDDPWVAAQSPHRVESSREQGDGVAPTVVSVLRGKNRAPL
jgi:hypothetical protein